MSAVPLEPKGLPLREVRGGEDVVAFEGVRIHRVNAVPVAGGAVAVPCGSGKWITSKRRRCLDFMVAALGLTLSSPVLAVLALLVQATSGRPILFRQRRMGRHGIEFTLYKFRSMCVEDRCGPHITVTGDARITPLGAFLRRYKLDELPQLWNVLKGEMSLVGPRPKLPHHEGLELRCRPGITGAATLTFRREEELLAIVPADELEEFYAEVVKPSKARLDLEYLQRATLRSDLRLIWATGASCLGIVKTQWDEEWLTLYDMARARRESVYRRGSLSVLESILTSGE